MKLNTRYALLALVITSARQTMTVQLTEEKRVTLPAWGRQIAVSPTEAASLTQTMRKPRLFRQPALTSEDFQQKTIDELQDQIKRVRNALQSKSQQRGKLRSELRELAKDNEQLAQLESQLAEATKALRTSRRNSTSTRRKLTDNRGDKDLANKLETFTKQANQAHTDKQKLEKELDAALGNVADDVQKQRLRRLSTEVKQLNKARQNLEQDMDELLKQS